MKILLLTTHLDFGGIGMYCVSLAGRLKQMGHKVKVASSGGRLLPKLELAGVEHIKLDVCTKSELSPLVFKAYIRLRRLFETDRPDVIHAQTRVAQALAYVVYKKTGVPYVSTCHGFFRPHLGRRLFGLWGKKAIAISEAVREHLVNDLKVKKEDVCLVHNGIDFEHFKATLSVGQKASYKAMLGMKDGPVIGLVARFSPVKGHKFLVEAVALARRQKPGLQLLLVGDGPSKKEIVDMVIKLGLGGNTFIEEPMLDTALPLSIMDIFVLSSVQEGLGLSVMEAMAAGVPVVATNVGGVYSLVKDQKTGLLAPPKDPPALAAAILRLLSDKELAKTLAAAAKEHIREGFSLQKMAYKIEGIYKEALSTTK